MDRPLLCTGIDVQHIPHKDTPKEIVDRIAALAKALADPAKDKLVEQGIVAVGGASEEFRAFHHRLHHRHRHHRCL